MTCKVLQSSHKRQRRGFTLIELMFAMASFSIMLVVAVSGFLNAMWIYNQASVSRDNQQQVRTIVDQIGRNVRSASRAYIYDSTLCLIGTPEGNLRYYQDGGHIRKTRVVSCDSSSIDYGSYTYTDLMSGGNQVKVSDLTVRVLQQGEITTPSGGSLPKAQSVEITIGIIRGTGAGLAASVRERQFSNEFKLKSVFAIRDTLR